jgi:hypothetical protein
MLCLTWRYQWLCGIAIKDRKAIRNIAEELKKGLMTSKTRFGNALIVKSPFA